MAKQQLQYQEKLQPIFDAAIHAWQSFVLESTIWTPPCFLFQQEMHRCLHSSCTSLLLPSPAQQDQCHSVSNSSQQSSCITMNLQKDATVLTEDSDWLSNILTANDTNDDFDDVLDKDWAPSNICEHVHK